MTETLALLLFWAAGIAGILVPVAASWKRGESGWFWICVAFFLGPLAVVVWLLAEHGKRAAARRSGPPV
jgi:bacteriorhodopsin